MNLDTQESSTIAAKSLLAAVSDFWCAPVTFLGAYISADDCVRGHAYSIEGVRLGYMEVVRAQKIYRQGEQFCV